MTTSPNSDDGKFLSDTVWNYGAFALMAGVGVILNFFIAAVMGITALGVFNQIYAVFVVVGQLAAMGIHDSAQKHTAEYIADDKECAILGAASVITAAIIGGIVALVLYLCSDLIGRVADSEPVGRGIALIAPGIGLFALNKTFMGILNGQRRMRAFAAVQSLRVTVILAFCLAVGFMDGDASTLGFAFTLAEALLTPVLWFLTRPPLGLVAIKDIGAVFGWLVRHVHFGTRALANGFLAESYIRIDIIMLGYFLDDAKVGIYSFAALFVEGLFQVPVVIRTVANPILVTLLKDRNYAKIAAFARRAALGSVIVYAAAGASVMMTLPYLAPFFPDGLVHSAHDLLWPLLTGLAVYAVFIPFDHMLLQAGMPGRQSALMAFNVFINVCLNAALIPVFGLFGAAIATAVSFALSSISVNIAAAIFLGFSRSLFWPPSLERNKDV